MMLFDDKYKIESDKLNVTISVKTNNTKKVKDKETGEVVDTNEIIYSPIGYFSTMTQAITWLYDYLLKKKSKEAKDIEELKLAIEDCKKEIIEEMRNNEM